jgi:hypothetical protein
VPRLYTSNWRQFLAIIYKEKFFIKEKANFNLERGVAKDPEDELDLITMAEQSNHTYSTFNRVYTGSTTLTISALLY